MTNAKLRSETLIAKIVAAAERGCRVLVARKESLMVADHDFTTFSIVSSVLLVVDIPDEISGSWYTGQVFVGLKDAVFEQSSLIRHMTELHEVLKMSDAASAPIFSCTQMEDQITDLLSSQSKFL